MKKHHWTYLGLVLFFLSLFLIARYEYHAQRLVGEWNSFTNPNYRQVVRAKLQSKNNMALLKLLDHGDSVRAGVAASVIAERGNQEMFEPIAKLLGNHSHDVRMSARRILPHLDSQKAGAILMGDLSKWDQSSFDYRDTLLMLSYMKYPPAYPYLVEYAKRKDAYKTGAAEYLADFGNPDSIPLLKEMLNSIPETNDIENRFARRHIQEAITSLQKIAAQQSSSGFQPNP